jgi:hypothetical protein
VYNSNFYKFILENCCPIESPANSEGEKMEFTTNMMQKLRAKEKAMTKLFLREYEQKSTDKSNDE